MKIHKQCLGSCNTTYLSITSFRPVSVIACMTSGLITSGLNLQERLWGVIVNAEYFVPNYQKIMTLTDALTVIQMPSDA